MMNAVFFSSCVFMPLKMERRPAALTEEHCGVSSGKQLSAVDVRYRAGAECATGQKDVSAHIKRNSRSRLIGT